MTDQKQLNSSELIVTAIRNLRRSPANLTRNTKSGVSLKRLWRTLGTLCSEEEFRRGLETLLHQDAILITATFHRGNRDYHQIEVTKTPNRLGECYVWHLDERGEYLDVLNPSDSHYNFIARMTVYVVADGLPKKARGAARKRALRQVIAENAMSQPTRFHLGDAVQWREDRFPAVIVQEMKRKYGEGPFEVVAVRLHTRQAREALPQAHPEAVTIEVANEERHEFAGEWFRKV